MLSLRRVYIIGFVLTLVIVVMLAGYAVYEPQRMAAASQRLTNEKIAAGSEVFASNCVSCHGKKGKGIPGDGPTLNSKEFLSAADNELIARTVKNGRPGTAMPAWAEENGGPLRSDQIDDVVAFIRSWEPTAPSAPKVTSTPTPTAVSQSNEPVKGSAQVTTTTTTTTTNTTDATNGQAVFQQNCASCHNADASGGKQIGTATSPDLRWNKIGPAGSTFRGDESLIARAILSGKDETGGDLDPAMPRWQGKLTDAQVTDIIAFLKTTGPATEAGNVQLGQQLFDSQGCVGCHTINGNGGKVGPDLTKVGSKREADWLTQWLKNPKPPMAPTSLGDSDLKDLVTYLSNLK